MTDSRHEPDREEIRQAVKRARNSLSGSYMSEEQLVIATRARLDGVGSDAQIRDEVRRQSPTWNETAVPAMPEPTPQADVEYRPSGWLYPLPDPLTALRADHWFTNREIRGLRQAAIYPQDLLRRRYDPARTPDFYRGGITALTAVVKMISPADSLQRYQDIVERIHTVMETWPGTEDQVIGANAALTHAYAFAGDGYPVSTLITALRMEIACAAECFRIVR